MKTIRPAFKLFVLFASLLCGDIQLQAQDTAFTYQGRLNDGGNAANGTYDLRFTIYDVPADGSIVAGPLTNAATAANNGLFTVTLNFGAGVFDGSARWLEIGVRTNGGVAAYSTLSPRQALTPTPYAMLAGTVPDGAITDSKLAPNSVNTAQLADGAVSSGKLDSSTVQRRVTGTAPGGSFLTGINQDGTVATGIASGGIWSLNGTSAYYTVGSVGVGTANPDSRFTVAGTGAYNSPNAAAITLDNTAAGRRWEWHVLDDGRMQLADFTLAATRLMIDTVGNVGIGTATPANKLTVLSDTDSYGLEHTDGNIRLGTYLGVAGAELGTISNHKLNFFVNHGASSMTIDTSGNVGIGTSTPGSKLEVAGNTRINGRLGINQTLDTGITLFLQARPSDLYAFQVLDSASAYALTLQLGSPNTLNMFGNANKNSGGTSWGTFSDRRLKQDVRAYEPGLNEVLQLRPVRFHYRDDVKKGLNSDHEEVGFIAQQVREVIPDAVTEGQDGYLMLKADPIHWAAINAIQELNTKLAEQRAENAGLKQRLEKLEQLMHHQNRGAK